MPSISQPKPVIHYHWFEAQLLLWQNAVAQRRATGKHRISNAFLGWLVKRLLRSGRKTPWLLHLWHFVGHIALSTVPKGPATRKSVLLHKVFDRVQTGDRPYRGGYTFTNVLTALGLFLVGIKLIVPVADIAYIVLTYQHNKYTNVVITNHYPDRTTPHVFSVLGYTTTANGERKDVFVEIGPSFWYQELTPESIFGKINDHDVCDFDGWGFHLRVQLALRYLSNESLYAVNPWIVDARCHTPEK